MVSSLGNTAVAAVSIFSQPRMVILCVTRSYSVALSAYVARRRGEDPDESLTACSRASLMLGCGLSILLLVGTWIGAARFYNWPVHRMTISTWGCSMPFPPW